MKKVAIGAMAWRQDLNRVETEDDLEQSVHKHNQPTTSEGIRFEKTKRTVYQGERPAGLEDG